MRSQSIKKAVPQPFRKSIKEGLQKYRELTWRSRVSPDFIIIGAQKCGTSSLYNYLAQHPQLMPAYKKEIHYFDNGLERHQRNYEKGDKWYRAHFPRARSTNGNGLAFEASPMYCFHPLVARRISEFKDNMRIVMMVRNPTERAISHYYHEVRNGREDLPLLSALQKETERVQDIIEMQDYSHPAYKNHTYKARGLYAVQLERYLKFFDKENIHIVSSEEFFSEPQHTMSSLFGFLGIEEKFRIPNLSPVNVSGAKKVRDPEVLEYLNGYFNNPNRAFFNLIGREFDW